MVSARQLKGRLSDWIKKASPNTVLATKNMHFKYKDTEFKEKDGNIYIILD